MGAYDILKAIKSKNWHAANEAFSSAVTSKIADRLATERKSIFKESLAMEPSDGDAIRQLGASEAGIKEDSDEATCKNCGYVKHEKTFQRDRCPKCNKSGIWTGAADGLKESVPPSKMQKGGTVGSLNDIPPQRIKVKEAYKGPHTCHVPGNSSKDCKACQGNKDANSKKPFGEIDPHPTMREGYYRVTYMNGKKEETLKFQGSASEARQKVKQEVGGGKEIVDVETLSHQEYVSEGHMPTNDVQRVYDEVRDVSETEILCGVRNLRVNSTGDVVSYVSESAAQRRKPKFTAESIEKITKARVTSYKDNGQTIAYIDWRDIKGKTGTTSGDPNNAHMKALLDRAKREGVKVVTEATSGYTKKAVIREPGVEPGKPAKMHLNCVCGNKVDMGMSTEYPGKGATCSKCGQKYDGTGYMQESRLHSFRTITEANVGTDRSGWKTVKVIPSHVGVSRWFDELDSDDPVGYVKSQHPNIRTPYSSGPTHSVYRWKGKNVIKAETSHKVYEIIEVPKSEHIYKTDDEASNAFIADLKAKRGE